MRNAVAALTVATVLGTTSTAHAQATFTNVQANGLPTVYVVDRTGIETRGRLVSITESLVSLDVNGTMRTFTPEDVSLIERRGDSLKNGALIGMGVGLFGGLLTLGLADCPGGGSNCAGVRFAGLLFATGVYAAVGAGIDAAITGRTRIWPRRGQQASGLVVSASPAERRAFVGWRIARSR